MKHLRVKEAKELLRKVGVTITTRPETQEYRVNLEHGTEETAYYTNSIVDAVDTGIAMGGHHVD